MPNNSNESSFKNDIKKRINAYFKAYEQDLPSGIYEILMTEVENILIEATLEFAENNQSKAAKILGINRNTLRKRMKISSDFDNNEQN